MKTCKKWQSYGALRKRTVTTFCKTGKIPGAVKEGKSWRIRMRQKNQWMAEYCQESM